MNTTLRPMRGETYPAYVETAIRSYADENVAAGRWPPVGALERSREDFESPRPKETSTTT